MESPSISKDRKESADIPPSIPHRSIKESLEASPTPKTSPSFLLLLLLLPPPEKQQSFGKFQTILKRARLRRAKNPQESTRISKNLKESQRISKNGSKVSAPTPPRKSSGSFRNEISILRDMQQAFRVLVLLPRECSRRIFRASPEHLTAKSFAARSGSLPGLVLQESPR